MIEYVSVHDKVSTRAVLRYALHKEQIDICLFLLEKCHISFYATQMPRATYFGDEEIEIDIARKLFGLTVKYGKIENSYNLLRQYDFFSNNNLMRRTYRYGKTYPEDQWENYI